MENLWAAVGICVLAATARADDVKITIDDPNVSADAAAWAKLPTLLLEVAGEVAEIAVRRTVAEVLAEEEPDETYENGVLVRAGKKPFWCGALAGAGAVCWTTRSDCAKRAKWCRVTKNVACFGSTSVTTGDEGVLCRPTYGECEQTRALFDLSREYTVGDCEVVRYRAKK